MHVRFVILSGMKHPKYHHTLADNLIKDFVRESPNKNTSKLKIVESFPFRINLQPSDRTDELV